MKIPENLTATTKNGLDISFDFNINCKPHGSDRWIYHKIDVFTFINKEKINVGYLRLAYISEEKFKENSSDIIQYLINLNKINSDNKELTTKNISISDIKNILQKEWPEGTVDNDIINYFKMIIKINHVNSYESHIRYHYLKPEPDYVEVKDEYRRKGIGLELYKKAIEFCNINGLNFYQSTTQTNEANFIWKTMKDTFENCNSYQYLTSKKDVLERFYFGNEKPILEIDNGLKNINKRNLSKRNINSI